MRLVNLIVTVVLLLGYAGAAAGCPADKVCLQEPTVLPATLDEFYALVDTGAGNWVFEGECSLQPRITWAQVKAIAEATKEDDTARVVIRTDVLDSIGVHLPAAGTLDISEDDLFGLAAFAVMRGAWEHGEVVTCKPEGDKVALQGETANDLLNALADYVR